jgi:hypothetical protein
MMEEKHKTSMNLNKELWQEWVQFVVARTGSTMTISRETELAIGEYMKRHPLDKKSRPD